MYSESFFMRSLVPLLAVALVANFLGKASRADATAAKHVVVYHEPGRFAGWPANNGAWVWGDEILVGFALGHYKANESGGHSLDGDRERHPALARSRDGGETWHLEEPESLARRDVRPLIDPIRFNDPDFALRVDRDRFRISYDRGRSWEGPYDLAAAFPFPLTSRTDYLVNGDDDCFLFLSGEPPEIKSAGYRDRAFCARTTDGGRSFRFVAWMTEETPTVRSVMPTTVRLDSTRLLSVLRRREGERCWIDAYGSDDDGAHWTFRGKVADVAGNNGNPPSLAKLPDGRLCVAYGTRLDPCGISATLSSDDGRTWSPPRVLRGDGRTWDLGYARTVVRGDGRLVTAYYFTTAERPEQHIAATIWEAPGR